MGSSGMPHHGGWVGTVHGNHAFSIDDSAMQTCLQHEGIFIPD